MTHDAITQFLSTFLAPKGTPLERAEHWLAVAHNPQQFHPQADAYEIRHRRRMARQNLRRLLRNHPSLITALQAQTA